MSRSSPLVALLTLVGFFVGARGAPAWAEAPPSVGEPPPEAPASVVAPAAEVASPTAVPAVPAVPDDAPVAAPATPAADSRSEAERQWDALPPPPVWMDWKEPLTRGDYLRKNEGWYVTGLPLANYDPNYGFGGGARGYLYHNGTRGDPLFAYTPYRHRLYLHLYFSTTALHYHTLDYDAPAVFDTPYRFRAALTYHRNPGRNYFGTGTASMDGLLVPGVEGSFKRYADYDKALRQLRPDGTAFSNYSKFDYEIPSLQFSVERQFLGGLLRPFVGLIASHVTVRDFAGSPVTAVDADGQKVAAVMPYSRLSQDCAAGLLVGCEGGWDNMLRAAVSFDTRDFEPDPNSGVFLDLSGQLGNRLFGSRSDFARLLFAARGFYSPFPQLADLVFAGRLTYVVQSEQTPFYTMNMLHYTEDVRTGLGGLRSHRGYKQDRFVGPVMAAFNAEARWTFHRFRFAQQNWALFLVPFVDFARVFDSVGQTTLAGWRRGQGAALRASWNQATVASIDYGFSEEDSGIYINFNHMF